MDEIVGSVQKKFYLFLVSSLVLMALSGFFTFSTVRGVVLSENRKTLARTVSATTNDIRMFAPEIESAKQIGQVLENIRYANTAVLRDSMFSELQEMGMIVGDVALKERSDIGRGVIEVTVGGMVSGEKLPGFVKAMSSRSKIWGVELFETRPRVSPVDLVNQFIVMHQKGNKRGLDELIRQGTSMYTSLTLDVKLKLIVIAG